MMRRLYDSCTWSVISDPLDVGGFEPDTRFSTQEVVFMLKYHSLTSGSVLHHNKLGEFTVIASVKKSLPFSLVNREYVGSVSNQNLMINSILT